MDREPQHHSRRFNEPSCSELRQYLTEEDEQKVLVALREQFWHDQRITSDDVRFVVRAVANHRGATSLPPDFPPTRWILNFKRMHGFTQSGGTFAIGQPQHHNLGSRSSSIARATASSPSSEGCSDDEIDGSEQHLRRYAAAHDLDALVRCSMRPTYDSDSQMQPTRRQQQQHRCLVVDNRRTGNAWNQHEQKWGREKLASSGSGDSENDVTTGTSSSSSVSASATPSTISMDDNRDSYASPQYLKPTTSGKRGYKLSHTVSPETWEKAIAAVEHQGMSLRAAAKIYAVHFAALHRRVKKRAQGGYASSKGTDGYFHHSDEAGIMRVVVARAELGVLMTFDELMKLVEVAALRKLPDISVANARRLMVRFQSRNEHSARHIIVNWPLSVPTMSSGPVASHYHLEHPGYDHRSKSSSPASMQRVFAARAGGGSATVAVVPAGGPSHVLPLPFNNGSISSVNGDASSINGSRPVLPSLNVNMSFRSSAQLQQQTDRVPCQLVTPF